MAKKHYVVKTAKKGEIIELGNGKRRLVIDEPISIVENNVMKYDNGDYISNIKREKYSFDIIVTLILYGLACVLLIALLVLLGVSKDFGLFCGNVIDNIIGLSALLLGIASISSVRRMLGRWLAGPPIIKKLWYMIMILVLPYFILYILQLFSYNGGISNICGVVGIIICIFQWLDL